MLQCANDEIEQTIGSSWVKYLKKEILKSYQQVLAHLFILPISWFVIYILGVDDIDIVT